MRVFPSENPGDEKRTELYEVGPPELSQIIENDPYSQSHFDALPTLTQHHLETLFPEPAEAAALLRMRRLHTVSENMGYIVSCGQSLRYQWRPYQDEDAAKKHGLVLAEISHIENTFPHLDFDSLLARIETSLTRCDYGYSRVFGAAVQKGSDRGDNSASDHDEWDIPIHADKPCIDRIPSTIYDLQHLFADPAEAAAICEYHRLSNELAANQHGLARHDIRALEKAFPILTSQ